MLLKTDFPQDIFFRKKLFLKLIAFFILISLFLRYLSIGFDPTLSAIDQGHFEWGLRINIDDIFSYKGVKEAYLQKSEGGVWFRPFDNIYAAFGSNIYAFNKNAGYLILSLINSIFNLIIVLSSIVISCQKDHRAIFTPLKFLIFSFIFFSNSIFITATSYSLFSNQQVIPLSFGVLSIAIYIFCVRKKLNDNYLIFLIPLSFISCQIREIYIIFPTIIILNEFLTLNRLNKNYFRKIILIFSFLISFFPSALNQLLNLDFSFFPYSIAVASNPGAKVEGYYTWERAGWTITSVGLSIFSLSVIATLVPKFRSSKLIKISNIILSFFSILLAFLSIYIDVSYNRNLLVLSFISLVIYFILNSPKYGFFYLIWFTVAYIPVIRFPEVHAIHTIWLSLPFFILISISIYDFKCYWENLFYSSPFNKVLKVILIIVFSLTFIRGFTILINNQRINVVYRDLKNNLTTRISSNEEIFKDKCYLIIFGFSSSYDLIYKTTESDIFKKNRQTILPLPFYGLTKRFFSHNQYAHDGLIDSKKVLDISNKCGKNFKSTGYLVSSPNGEPKVNFPENLKIKNTTIFKTKLLKPFDPLMINSLNGDLYPSYGIDDSILRWEIYGTTNRKDNKVIKYVVEEYELK